MVEQLSKNITRQGLTNYTLNFLRVSPLVKVSTNSMRITVKTHLLGQFIMLHVNP